MPVGLSIRMSSAYGTHDAGRSERRPEEGAAYGGPDDGAAGAERKTAVGLKVP